MVSPVQIGISAFNDKLRFNLYLRPRRQGIEGFDNIHRSNIFDLKIDPITGEIKNKEALQEFADILNTVLNVSPACIGLLYEEFLIDTNKKFEKEKKLSLKSSRIKEDDMIRNIN